MKNIISKFTSAISRTVKNTRNFFTKRQFVECVFIAFLLNFAIEAFSRKSILSAVEHIFTSPLFFLYNILIILATLCIGLLFKRKYFYITVLSTLWLSLGIANFILLNFRQRPLGAIDLLIVKSCIPIMGIYMDLPQIILVFLLIALAISGIIVMFFKAPKVKNVSYIKSTVTIVATLAVLLLVTVFPVNAHIDPDGFSNLSAAYSDYGFAYCFSRSLLDTGIDKPEEYSENQIKDILASVGEIDNSGANTDCNIILIQLESFIDISKMNKVTTSSDPTPVFNALKENFSHGYLTVPSIGAGTANTEFEVLTSMSLDYFGAGEYPYKTILKSSVCESAPFVLSELGYKTHVLHNHVATFYDRHKVYGNLGFDNYVPLEMMTDLKFNPTNWCEDSVLTNEIMKTLKSSEAYDFIFGITVQTHGQYPNYPEINPGNIKSEGYGNTEEEKYMFEYYLSQLNKTDAFIGDLIDSLEELGEPYVLILYGDHIPSMTIEEDEYDATLFQTEYVICDNIGLEFATQDLTTYQLMPYVFEMLDLDGGLFTKYHQACINNTDYEDKLELLQYDVLYGKMYAYGLEKRYTAKTLRMGACDISIETVTRNGTEITVDGGEFNKFSVICVNGNRVDTVFVDGDTVTANVKKLNNGDIITVIQYTHDYLTLYETNEYVYHSSTEN